MKLAKREGQIVSLDLNKIKTAILKAAKETQTQIPEEVLDTMVIRVLAHASEGKEEIINIEDVQDAVELVLMQCGYEKTAKAYVVYRKHHEDLRHGKGGGHLIQQYLDDADWRVKENSTVTSSLGGLILYNSGAVTADYWLNYVYDRRTADMHKSGDFHIHDMSMLSGYCAGWSLKQLICMGITGVEGRIASAPAMHLATLCNQMVNFLGIMQNEWAGAQAFSSFDTYLAAYVKYENLTYAEVKQAVQSFVHGVNIPSRWGTQAPFTNITLDWVVPSDMKDKKCHIGAGLADFTYGECQKEMDMVNKAFLEIMIDGDANGRGFQYPIPTYSITKNFDWSDTENNRLLFEMTAKYGTPYFSNYINSDMEPSDVRSMCCRLRLDLRELRKKSGGYFGSGESTGSVGVVTINMPRIGYLADSESEFFKLLDDRMDVAASSLSVKRRFITELLEKGLYPYTKAYLGSFENHFSTIGLVGMNECCLNASWLKKSLTEKEAQEFTKKVLNHMRARLSDYQEQYGDLYNLEATPAESTSYRLAKHDKKRFTDIVTAGTAENPYYTNSSHLPVDYTSDIFDALDIQDELQTLYTSGTVFHTFLGEKLSDWKAAAVLVRKIAENYKLPYYTMSPTYSICKEHGYLAGEQHTCPHCGKETEVYSRITGYYRPVKNWNDGKSQEYAERKTYVVEHPTKAESVSVKEREKTTLLQETDLVVVGTKVCTNCKLLKEQLREKGIPFKEVFFEENPEFARTYHILTAPTCVYKGKTFPSDSILDELGVR